MFGDNSSYNDRTPKEEIIQEMTEQNTDTYTTSDIGIAAYLQMFEVKLLQCYRMQGGRFFFEFDNPQECKKRAIEFLSSDFCKFDNNIRNLKKILFS